VGRGALGAERAHQRAVRDHHANPPIRSARAREIVAAARWLLEREGPAGLSMRRVAERFEVADSLLALGAAYRAFALEHPHLYRLMFQGPLPRERLVPGAEQHAAAPVIAAAGGDGDRGRAVFAFAHGMMILELDDRFPPGADIAAAWARGLSAFAP
jgi:Tetracyclin repressor-like, C-terminal domain